MAFLGKKFGSREELIKALDAEIEVSEENGGTVYSIDGGIGREAAQSQGYRQRAQKAEKERDQAVLELSRVTAEMEEVEKLNPHGQKEVISGLTKEIAALKVENKKLTEEREPLRTKLGDYEKRETTRTIERALEEAATEIGVRKEALRDVRRLASLLKVDSETGEVSTTDGNVPVRDFVQSEFTASPHWSPTSTGGGSNPGTAPGGKIDTKILREQARKEGDIEAMLGYTPFVERQRTL